MAICPTQSYVVKGLSYSKDFFEMSDPIAPDIVFFNMIATRRAIRNFKDKPVPKELLEKIVHAITFAPPGFTRELFVAPFESIGQKLLIN